MPLLSRGALRFFCYPRAGAEPRTRFSPLTRRGVLTRLNYPGLRNSEVPGNAIPRLLLPLDKSRLGGMTGSSINTELHYPRAQGQNRTDPSDLPCPRSHQLSFMGMTTLISWTLGSSTLSTRLIRNLRPGPTSTGLDTGTSWISLAA